MRSDYYYLVASLPLLDFSLSAAITYEDFLRRSREQLLDYDMAIIEQTTLAPSQDTQAAREILRKWKEFDLTLRNELVKMRAAKKAKDSLDYIRGDYYPNPFIAHFAHLIFNQSSPLEAEKMFNRVRWDKIEELKVGHFFDIDYLVCYCLQLQILERWKKMKQEDGEKILEKLVGQL